MKKSIFSLLVILLTISIMLPCLASCDTSEIIGSLDIETTTQKEVESIPVDEEEHSYTLETSENGTYTYTSEEEGAEDAIVTIACESGTANAYTVEGNTITFTAVTEDSVYTINGTFYGNIVVDSGDDYKFELSMQGFTITSYNDCPIAVLTSDKFTLSAKNETENFIYDMRDAVSDEDEDYGSCFYSKTDTNIQGKGTLNVYSENNNGIHTKKDLKVKNLTLQVECEDNALKGNDSVTIESGNLTLIARVGDGIKTTNTDISSKGNQRGIVTLNGGTIVIYAACDGIDASYDVVTNEEDAETPLNLSIYTDKYSSYSEEVTATSDDCLYIRYSNAAYKFSVLYYNSDTDYVWKNATYFTSSQSSSGGGNPFGGGGKTYYYYKVDKLTNYEYLKVYMYSSSQTAGQSDTYLAVSENKRLNETYDTMALTYGNKTLAISWTNYTTQQSSGMGRGGMGGMGGMSEGNSDKGDHSTKGIKAGNCITINAGTIYIQSYDDGFHATEGELLENTETSLGNITINGGDIIVASNDDGIHADNLLTVTGGNIVVTKSYEGLEGKYIKVSNGNISIVSSDDGMNATTTTGEGMTLTGGTLYVYAGGDGVDSNSRTSYDGILFGGINAVVISTSSGNSALDTEQGYKYTAGIVIGIASSGGMSSENTYCSNFSSIGTKATLSLTKDAYLTVGNLVTVKMPVSMNAMVVCLGSTSASISKATSSSKTFDYSGVCWE